MQRMHCLREGHSPAGLHSTWKWELLLFGTITQAGPDLWIQHGKTLHCLVSTHAGDQTCGGSGGSVALFLALAPSGSWLGLRFLLAAGGGVGVRLPPATGSMTGCSN